MYTHSQAHKRLAPKSIFLAFCGWFYYILSGLQGGQSPIPTQSVLFVLSGAVVLVNGELNRYIQA